MVGSVFRLEKVPDFLKLVCRSAVFLSRTDIKGPAFRKHNTAKMTVEYGMKLSSFWE